MEYMIPDKVYLVLKWVGLIVMPASATLVSAVGAAIGWDGASVVATIITAVGTFVGTILGASAAVASKKEQ